MGCNLGRELVGVPSKRHARTDAERIARRAAKYKRYANSPLGKYQKHKKNAKRRGITFELTYADWWDIWQRSGRWSERGNGNTEGYVMARKGDTGPYALGNVEIITHGANVAERNTLYRRPSFYGASTRYRQQQRGAPGPDVPF